MSRASGGSRSNIGTGGGGRKPFLALGSLITVLPRKKKSRQIARREQKRKWEREKEELDASFLNSFSGDPFLEKTRCRVQKEKKKKRKEEDPNPPRSLREAVNPGERAARF